MDWKAADRQPDGGGDVQSRIMDCAVAEFMEKGFSGASLRSIASAAAVTTGAIYGYFVSKEALFDAVVAPACDELHARYVAIQEGFYELPPESQALDRMQDYEDGMVHGLLDFVYDHRDAFVLVLSKSAGTSWETYLDRFVDLEVESTLRYEGEMRSRGIRVNALSPEMARILASMFFRGYFEPLMTGMPRTRAHLFLTDYERFFHAGYEALMMPGSET